MGKRRVSPGVTIALMALTATLTLTLTYQYAMNRFNQQVKNLTERQKMYAKLYQVDTKTRDRYLYDIDENKLDDAITKGYVSGLSDPYSQFLTQSECTALQKQLAGRAEGVGMDIALSDSAVVVTRLIDGAPAAVAGVQKDDRIVRVDGQNVTGWSVSQVADALAGSAGTEVSVEVARGASGEGNTLSFVIPRREYDTVTVSSRMLDNSIGYIRIYSFDAKTADAFADALNALTRGGAAGLIIDVRNNGGGTLESAAKILDSLLPAGSIVSSAGADGKHTVLYTSDAAQNSLPLAVLINQKSASAAELIAAAVQDYHRGVVVGTQSYGKGTLQELFTFTDGSGLYLTTANFYPPLSGSFTDTGVTPDYDVRLQYNGSLDLLNDADDTQLNAAISRLTQGDDAPEQPAESDASSADDTQSDADASAESSASSQTSSRAASDSPQTASSGSAYVAMVPGCGDALHA